MPALFPAIICPRRHYISPSMALLVLDFLTSQSLAQAQAAGAPEKVFLLDAADTVEGNDGWFDA